MYTTSEIDDVILEAPLLLQMRALKASTVSLSQLDDTISVTKISPGGRLVIGRLCIELQHLRNNLLDAVVVQQINERLSALGNCMACNDHVALTHTDRDKNDDGDNGILCLQQSPAIGMAEKEHARHFFIFTLSVVPLDRMSTAVTECFSVLKHGAGFIKVEPEYCCVESVDRHYVVAFSYEVLTIRFISGDNGEVKGVESVRVQWLPWKETTVFKPNNFTGLELEDGGGVDTSCL
ncbi:eukaryotic translation initiation factor 6-2 [Tanacetum coccineum]